MPRLVYGILFMLLACWSLLLSVVFGADAAVNGPADNLDQLRTIIDAVDVDSADAARWAEDAYRTIRANGKNNARAAYALAVVRIRQRKYTEAAELLDGLTPAEQASLPLERLRLWLALQLDKREQAESLFQSLVKRMSNSSNERPAELSETAHFLGGLVGMLANDAAESPIAAPQLVAAVKLIPAAYSSAFRQSQRMAAQRRTEIVAFVATVQGAQPDPEKLRDKSQKLKTAEIELATALDALDATDKERRILDEQGALQRISLGKQYESLRDSIKRGIPVPETGVGKNRGAAWEDILEARERNARRRASISEKLRDVTAKMALIESAQRTRGQEITGLRREFETKQREVHSLQSELRLMRELAEGDFATVSRRVLHQPAQYEILSFAAERQRLLKSLDAEKK